MQLEPYFQLLIMVKESAVRGHHVYKDHWTPSIGQRLSTIREEGNEIDRYAIAVILGHMPQEISRLSWYFIEHGISCEITGSRRLSTVPGKGLEVPCTYTYAGK